MNPERAREILDTDIDTDYEGFAKGIAIIGKYAKGKFNYNFGHEQMWFGDFEETVEQMAEDEVNQLHLYGWFEDEDSWSHFS